MSRPSDPASRSAWARREALRSCRFRTALTEHPADPEAHRRIAQVLGPDYPFEQVVKIRVDLASEVFSPVYTLTQASENEVKRFRLERYGYRSVGKEEASHGCC
jgi:hypothetical protein